MEMYGVIETLQSTVQQLETEKAELLTLVRKYQLETKWAIASMLHKTLPGFGEIWFDQQTIINFLGFAELKDQFQITYDSDKED